MSRIGKMPVKIESGVEVNISPENFVTIKSGKVSQVVGVKDCIKVEVVDSEIQLTRKNEEKQTNAYHGLYRSLVNNAMVGVSKGWSKELILNGVGYRSKVSGSTLELNLGYSHLISYPIPEGIKITVEKTTNIKVEGANKELVGQVSAKIRGFRPPEPYLGKGVRYSDEVIKRKAGKSGK